MISSMHVLTAQLFDYAGLFPPAKLKLPEAIKNYLHYQREIHALGKFILPAHQWAEAVSILTHEQPINPIPFSILLTPFKAKDEFVSSLHKDCNHVINLMNKLKSSEGSVASFEILLSKQHYFLEEDLLFIELNVLMSHLKKIFSFHHSFDVFVEIPFIDSQTIDNFLNSIANYNNSHTQQIFIKLRTGGITPESVPSAEILAQTVYLLGQYQIPFKVTAGLHVPVPNFNSQVNAKMHGFLNVIFAAMMSFMHHKKINAKFLINILQNLQYTNVIPGNTEILLDIQNHQTSFTNTDIKTFRKNCFKGIGTCDFIEPLEHLAQNFS